MPRVKPFKRTYEKEIVMCAAAAAECARLPACLRFPRQGLARMYIWVTRRYAHFKKLDYFSTECVYAPHAYRGFAREFLKDVEAIRPAAIIGAARRARGALAPGVGHSRVSACPGT